MKNEDIPHPGVRIRKEVIPQGMSVTEVAQLIGVGRPALSNLLNGNASLSIEMATRFEKAFKRPREGLMEMQAQYDAARARQKIAPANARTYVPPFLAIKANDVERWVSHNIPARGRLPVLLRMLVHSTGIGLTKVDFPGNDDAERAGWDGLVEASEGTPWVPAGRSGWESGTNENVKAKAEGDFAKNLKALKKNDRAETTFVFVTPRRWPGKSAWVGARQAERHWKDVRAYDASDLEQWLEQSPPAQVWFANETRMPAEDVRSLDKCWKDWAAASTPPLTGSLFGPAVEAGKRAILARLSRPSNGPILITADSTEEALAFLAQVLGERGGEELSAYRDRVLVFDKPGVLPRLAEGGQSFIPVAITREVERELAPYASSMHSIVVYPRNAANIEPHIVLEPTGYETFGMALEEMGKTRDEISRLADESGRSLTVLRRRLATLPAVQMPQWAANQETATTLVPFLFVGAWNSQNETDKLGLSLLAGDRAYADLEGECLALAQLNDAPIWSVGAYRGVVSKIDLLHAIAGAVIPADLTRYFSMARMVLGEDDPALDLDERQRWAAQIHGKTRAFSSAFRNGISETLVLLAVYGGHLFKQRIGFDTAVQATLLVRELLPTPLTTRALEANDRDLPTYAEAAPDEFLSILERDLACDSPAAHGLLRPLDASVFGLTPSRSGLLWALEALSWNPETLPRAALILARLAEVEINDNWVNKPMHSLGSIFRAWMPQTAATDGARVDLMKTLAERFPNVAWKLCVAQFGGHQDLGEYSYKPRWRPDGYGFGEPLQTWEPILAFVREMVEMALNWKEHTVSTLCDLVERLHDLTGQQQARVWSLIEAWPKGKVAGSDKAALREKIRVSTLSWRAAMRAKQSGRAAPSTTAAKAAYAALEPSDILDKYVWLFRDAWIEESADEIEDIEIFDVHKHDERIQTLRVAAMREIRHHRGFTGLLELAEHGEASWWIGVHAAKDLLSENELQELLKPALRMALEGTAGASRFKNAISGALHAVADDDKLERILSAVADDFSEEATARLLLLAPFNRSTWKLADALGEVGKTNYWTHVTPGWMHGSETGNRDAVERLLKAGRPRAAFSYIRLELNQLDPQVLFRLLSELAMGGEDRLGKHPLDYYDLERAFKCLNASAALTLEQKASLEFAFIEALARPWDSRADRYGIPNLERYVEAHPELFVQAVAWTSERKDVDTDPTGFQVPSDRAKNLAERGYKLLEAVERIPGHDDLGELKADRLAQWIATVRQSCAALSRANVADSCIGRLLAHAPMGNDGVWPCESVREVMEEIQSEAVMSGAHVGVYNSRGVHGRGEGGDQERELAEKYRRWGQALQCSHPFVAAKLLMALAKTYDQEAGREDTEAGIRRRLR